MIRHTKQSERREQPEHDWRPGEYNSNQAALSAANHTAAPVFFILFSTDVVLLIIFTFSVWACGVPVFFSANNQT